MAAAVGQAEATGVSVWTGQLRCHAASAALAEDDLDAADGLIADIVGRVDQRRRLDVAYHQQLVSWRALLAGDLPRAAAGEASVVTGTELAVPFFEATLLTVAAQAHRARGDAGGAAERIGRSLELARDMGSVLLEWRERVGSPSRRRATRPCSKSRPSACWYWPAGCRSARRAPAGALAAEVGLEQIRGRGIAQGAEALGHHSRASRLRAGLAAFRAHR